MSVELRRPIRFDSQSAYKSDTGEQMRRISIAGFALFLIASTPMASPASVATPTGPGSYEESNSAIAYVGDWTAASSPSDSSGSVRTATSGQASAELTFNGTSVRWVSRKARGSGKNDVYIDGSKVATVDRYSASTQYQQVVFELDQLPPGEHTISIRRTDAKNADATGASVVIDRLDVMGPPAHVSAAPESRSVVVGWDASDTNATGYNLWRGDKIIATLPSTQSSFTDWSMPGGAATYTYRVSTVYGASETVRSVSSAAKTPIISVPTYPTFDESCDGGQAVRSSAELMMAFNAATPGTKIKLEPGTYEGGVELNDGHGTASSPIWVCGPRTAVFASGSNKNPEIQVHLQDSAYVNLVGFSTSGGGRGVMVDRSSHITVSDLKVSGTGQEGIHLRKKTTDSLVAGNDVSQTGLLVSDMGEGIYVGSAVVNWCKTGNNHDETAYSGCSEDPCPKWGCEPDRSDRNTVAANTIHSVASEGIDVKEGSVDGTILANHISDTGSGMSDGQRRAIVSRTSGWYIADNEIQSTNGGQGVEIYNPRGTFDAVWGYGNVVVRNSVDITGEPRGWAAKVKSQPNIISCRNVMSGDLIALTSYELGCQS